MNRVKTTLVFPPQWDPKQPYLALPALAARLRVENLPVELVDANVEFYDTLLERSWLETEIRPRLEIQTRRGAPPAARALEMLPAVAGKLDEAVGVLRDAERFFNLQHFQAAKDVISAALFVISAAYYPTQLGFYNFKMRYPFTASGAILEAARDERENPFLEYLRSTVVPRLRESNTSLVGISVSSINQVVAAITLARLVKEDMPKTLVVIGGNTFNRFLGQLRRNPRLYRWVDAYIVGEGETPLVALVHALDREEELDGVPNLFWRADWRRTRAAEPRADLIRETPRCAPEDMDALPTPVFEGLPLDRYFSPLPVLPVETSRGCLWGQCAFCSHFLVGESFRYRKPETVLADLQILHKRYGAVHFNFTDNTMPVKIQREISQGLIESGSPFHWTCYARYTPAFNDRFCELLARAGCRSIWFGLESASQRVLDRMNKGTRIEVARESTQSCLRAGVAVDLFCMVGFPSEMPADALETYSFIMEIREQIIEMNGLFALEAFALDSCSRVGHEPDAFGVIVEAKEADKTGQPGSPIYERDLDPQGKFSTREGLSPGESSRLVAFFNKRLSENIPPLPLHNADREAHVLLYRSDPAFRKHLKGYVSYLRESGALNPSGRGGAFPSSQQGAD